MWTSVYRQCVNACCCLNPCVVGNALGMFVLEERVGRGYGSFVRVQGFC